MCFSAQASFTAAAVIGVIGVASIIKAKPSLRPLAFTPLIFALQQATEGVVWVTLLDGDTTSLLHKASMYIFLMMATMLWPVWVPWVLLKAEKNQNRKRWLRYNVCIGWFIAVLAGLGLLLLKHFAVDTHHHISYSYDLHRLSSVPREIINLLYYVMFILYIFPTIISWFISTVRGTWILGIFLAVGWVVSMVAYFMSFGSVWCFFSAVTSIIIFFIV